MRVYLSIKMFLVDFDPTSFAFVGRRRLKDVPKGLGANFTVGRGSVRDRQKLVPFVRHEFRLGPILKNNKTKMKKRFSM